MKKYSKYITYIFIILFLVLFSINNFDEYKNFHQNKIEIKEKNISLNNKIENFELQNIEKLSDVQFYYTPNKKLLEKIISIVNNAKNEIYLETYILTEKRIQQALIKAYNR
jgi:phosphatidylserine/phosphatidylglycerophosphate/cardiolipin synthase-like enzyme